MNARVEGQQRRGQLRGGIGVREAAAERALVADRRVAHVPRGFGQERRALDHRGRGRQLGVARERADAKPALRRRGDAGQLAQAVDVHQHRGSHQPHVQHRDQALPAGQELGVAGCFREQRDRLGQAPRARIAERGGLHVLPSGP